MIVNRPSIVHSLEQLLNFLEADARFLLREQICDGYADRARSLLEKASQRGEVLYVGILGGTGVGKSTLINALAGKKISDPSDRRPFTDKAVLYRHSDTPGGLENVRNFIRELHALHDIDEIKDLVLLDLPDFDSKDEDNLRAVLAVLPQLDAVVWVVSPEKYADAVFYDMVRKTAMHRENFTFIFNKSDELIQKGGPDTHGHLKEVLDDLAFRLQHEAGLELPRVYSLSAAEEFDRSESEPLLAREFQRFRDYLMVRRDAKEIASMKVANLWEELRRLVREISADVRPWDMIKLVRVMRKAQLQPAETTQAKSSLTLLDREQDLSAAIAGRLASSDSSIWPVRAVMRVLSPGRFALSVASRRGLDEAFAAAAEVLAKHTRSDLEESAARIDSELLLAIQTTEAFREMGEPGFLIDREILRASTRLAQDLQERTNQPRVAVARWIRIWQRLVLFFPVLILVVKLAGLDRIEDWLIHPSAAGGLALILGFLTGLFGTEGLVGLLVLAICELVLILLLSVRRTKKIERTAARLARSAVESFDAGLSALRQNVRDNRERAFLSIEEALQRLNALEAACSSFDLGKPG